MTARDHLPVITNNDREEWLHDETDEPDFPEPYRSLYRQYVREMEEDTSILPGMGTVVKLLIRKLARDYIAGLMVDRRDALHGEVVCSSCGNTNFVPFWPENSPRLIRSAQELLKQAARADLEGALRMEFVMGLVSILTDLVEKEVEDVEERIRLKELLRGEFVRFTRSRQESLRG